MRVKMLKKISGTRNGQDWPAPGEEITLADDEAATLCGQGMAEPVTARAKVEKAVSRKAPETRGETR